MYKLIFCAYFLVVIGGINNAYAQNVSDSLSLSGNEIIIKGVELFDNGKYEEALNMFLKVNPCDPVYPKACYEIAYTYDKLGDYKTALQKCQQAIEIDSTDIQTFIFKGSLLDQLGRSKDAIDWLEFVRNKYPYNQSLLYNLAICYINNGEIQKAEATLLKGIHYNPYHATSHLALAKINFIMGRKAQSYLAYNMGIIMNPRLDYIKSYEEAIMGKIDSISKSYLYPYPLNVNHGKWDDLTALLNAEVAFRENFPVEYNLNFLSCRQSVFLIKQMKFEEKDTSLYNQFYVRFFKKILEDNELESYMYYSLGNAGSEQVTEWLKKNEAVNDTFISHAKQTIEQWKKYGFSIAKEKKHQRVFHFNENAALESVGILNETSESAREGIWHFISETGTIEEKGSFRNNMREGEFLKYWPDGSIKQQLNYKGDKLDGLNYTFHPNGVKSGIFPRNNNISEGMEEEYNPAGKLFSRTLYKNGKIEGPVVFIDYINGFRSETPYINNKCQGMMTEYWLNGIKKTEAMYGDSLLNGPCKKWYANGQLEWEGSFVNNLQVGKWISYFSMGGKSAEGTYDENGNLTGIYTEFDRQGKMTIQISGFNNGEKDGIQTFYFPDGKVQAKLVIQKDIFKHIECFDLAGYTVYNADEKDGELNYKYFFPEGLVKLEGTYKNGLKEGIWKFYNVYGKLTEEESWMKGIQSGIQKQYYSNGNLQLVYTCDSGKISGEVNRYFENGHPAYKGYYNSEGPTGLWTTYYTNDSIENQGYLINDKFSGRKMSYSPDGKLTTEEKFNNNGESLSIKYFDAQGKISEVINIPGDSTGFVSHYPNGNLKVKLSFSNRKRNGLQEYYYPNGKLKKQISFIHGNAEGESRQWDHQGNLLNVKTYRIDELDGKLYGYENGKIDFIDTYEMGSDDGLYQEFYPNGHVMRTFNEEAGKRQGLSEYYAPDSTWMYSVVYRDNEICTVSYFDNLGKLHSDERIDTTSKGIVCYYKNGKVAARIPIENGIFNGKYAIYYPNGQLLREINYVNDYREGLTKHCYENGSIHELTNWQNGSKDGNYALYFSNGKKAIEGKYHAGKKYGKWLFFNETGKLIETLSYADDEVYEIN